MKFFQPPILLAPGVSVALNADCADTNSVTASAPVAATNFVSYAPGVLPGNGLAQHPFLYTGEWDHRKTNQTIFVVREGKVAWTYDIPINDTNGTLQELGDATMLSNGNIVFCRKVGASEITPEKKIIWNMDVPEYKFFIFQEASRLANGDTVICNWCPYNLKDTKTWPGSVQVLEVSPEKKVVWALSEWKNPDLGPASSIQLLDEPGVAENGDLQR